MRFVHFCTETVVNNLNSERFLLSCLGIDVNIVTSLSTDVKLSIEIIDPVKYKK